MSRYKDMKKGLDDELFDFTADVLDKRKARPSNLVRFSMSSDDENKAILVPFSDLHVGSPQFNYSLFEENLSWCFANPNVYLYLNGDMLECATKTSVGAGVYEQVLPINEQINYVVQSFMPFAVAGRIVATTNGNHEDRTYKQSGIDVSRVIAQMLDIPYLINGGHIALSVDKQLYRVYATHGSSGARMPHTKIRSCLELASFVDADIYLMGHVHELQHHAREFQKYDSRRKVIDKKSRHFILTGHYLNWENGYAQQTSMIPSKQGTPKIKLSGDEHRIRVSI